MKTHTLAVGLQAVLGGEIALEGVKFAGDLRGPVLEARLDQRYRNPSSRAVEVVYRFPLPRAAAVLGVEVEWRGRWLAARVFDREAASIRYEDAVADGDRALLVERLADGSVFASLGNLPAGAACRVRLHFAQVLPLAGDAMRLMLPTVMAPAAADRSPTATTREPDAPHQAVTASLTAGYSFALALTVHGALARARIASPSHALVQEPVATPDGHALHLTLARAAALDRDLVITFADLPPVARAAITPDPCQPGYLAVVASVCTHWPSRGQDAGASSLAVRLLVDCSGAMAGDGLSTARRVAHALVASLDDGDRVALSRFGRSVVHDMPQAAPLDAGTRTRLQSLLDGLLPTLGTAAPRTALQPTLLLPEGDHDVLVLVTQGAVPGIASIAQAAQVHGCTVCVVGVGSAVLEGELRALAAATGSTSIFIAPGEPVTDAVATLLRAMRQRGQALATLQWQAPRPTDAAPVWLSPLPPLAFNGDAFAVQALLLPSTPGPLAITAQMPGSDDAVTVAAIDLQAARVDGATPARLVAAARIAAWLEGSAATESDRRAATELALAHGLVTTVTSAVLVDPQPAGSVADGMPALLRVPQMLAAGWSGWGLSRADANAPLRVAAKGMARPDAAPHGVSDDLHARYFDTDDMQAARAAPSLDMPAGNTPRDWATWLHRHAPPRWPASLKALERAGLDASVRAWLARLCEQSKHEGVDARAVVLIFLQVLSGPAMRARLQVPEDAAPPDPPSRARRRSLPYDTALAARIETALAAATAGLWPGADMPRPATG